MWGSNVRFSRWHVLESNEGTSQPPTTQRHLNKQVTNVFNLDGMNCVVDAACASSLVAVKVAIDELLSGDCDTMIAGATCTDNSIGMYMAFSKTPVFSTKQSVTAYDRDTKGMLIGEGSVMLVLKKLDTAVRDGDRIHAVINACSSSSDGKCSGIYSPTVEGQEQCIRRAYAKAGVDVSSTTIILLLSRFSLMPLLIMMTITTTTTAALRGHSRRGTWHWYPCR